MFWKKKVKDGAVKIDKVITWLIVWTAVASMVGLSRTKKWKEVTSNLTSWVKKSYNKWKGVFWSVLVGIINFLKKK